MTTELISARTSEPSNRRSVTSYSVKGVPPMIFCANALFATGIEPCSRTSVKRSPWWSPISSRDARLSQRMVMSRSIAKTGTGRRSSASRTSPSSSRAFVPRVLTNCRRLRPALADRRLAQVERPERIDVVAGDVLGPCCDHVVEVGNEDRRVFAEDQFQLLRVLPLVFDRHRSDVRLGDAVEGLVGVVR